HAIDRVDHLKEKYGREVEEIEKEITLLGLISAKPFEKEEELAQLKNDLSRLEREIAIKIQESHMKQHGLFQEQPEIPVTEQTPVISIHPAIKKNENELEQLKAAPQLV